MPLTRTVTRKPDATIYVLAGESGAVSLIIRDDYPGIDPIGIHGRDQVSEGSRPGSCDVLPEGECWADCTYRGGAEAYELYRGGGEDAMFGELEAWYRSRWPGETEGVG